jgi:hypothetical protein
MHNALRLQGFENHSALPLSAKYFFDFSLFVFFPVSQLHELLHNFPELMLLFSRGSTL